jgi:hypothetical protein
MTPPAAPTDPRSSAPPGSATSDNSTPPTPPPHESPFKVIKELWRELPGLFSDRVELLWLELHRAGLVLAQIAALVVAAAILGVTAWLVLWSAVVALLTMAGVHWLLALAIVLVINLVAAWLAVARVRRLLPSLKLPATRRHLTLSPSTQPPPDAPFEPTSTPVTPRASARPVAPPTASPVAPTKATGHNRHEPPDIPTASAAGR